MRLFHKERGQEQRVTGRAVPSPSRAQSHSTQTAPQWGQWRVSLPAPESKTSRTSRKSSWEQQEIVLHMPEVCPGDKVTSSPNQESTCKTQPANHYRRGQDKPQNSSKTQLEISTELNWSSWSHEGAWEGVPRKGTSSSSPLPQWKFYSVGFAGGHYWC